MGSSSEQPPRGLDTCSRRLPFPGPGQCRLTFSPGLWSRHAASVSARSFRLSVGIRPPYGCPLCLDILVPHRKDSNVSVFIHSGVSLLSRAQGPGQVRGHRGVYQGWPWVDLLSLVQVAIASVIWSHSQHPWEAALDDVDTQKEMK